MKSDNAFDAGIGFFSHPGPVFTLMLIIILACGHFFVYRTHAANIEVDTFIDELDGLPGNGSCSLREAIANSNNNDQGQGDCADCRGGDGPDVITLPAGTYILSLAGADENGNETGDLDITGALTINGAGMKSTAIQAGTYSSGVCSDSIDRVFQVFSGGVLEINDATIRCGRAPDGEQGTVKNGGGVYNEGDLAINRCSVYKNRAGDGIGGNGGSGGGIYNSGSLTLNDASISSNEAGDGSDGGSGEAGGFGGDGGGIYIYYQKTMVMIDSVVAYNFAGDGGDGGDAGGGDAGDGGLSGGGGGIYNIGTSQIYSSDIHDNTSGAGGNGGDVTSGEGNGGEGRSGGYGAGILCGTGAVISLIDSNIEDNSSGAAGAGGAGAGSGSPGDDGQLGHAGGLYLTSGDHTISGCSFRNNSGYKGGGIYICNVANTSIKNSTFSRNLATDLGGGICNYASATISLNHVTISENIADVDNTGGGDGGGIYTASSLTMTNTIVAGNSDKGGQYPDLRGEVVSQDYNIVGICDGSYCLFTQQPHDQVGETSPVDPLMGDFQDNGGPTDTYSVKYNGPAGGQIPEGVNGCDTSAVDQRGVMRIAPCDIGAYENGKVWAGVTDGDWHTADNWLPNGIPAYGDPATIHAGANAASCSRGAAYAAGVIIAADTLSLDAYSLTIGESENRGGAVSHGCGRHSRRR